EKFYRVKDEDRATVPGTGLGMYITKEFVENMGGKVWFTSVHGKGTEFNFSLPVEGLSASATKQDAPDKKDESQTA
ncbi:MAG: sensor histidine kinase, partial [Candidatus Saccharibacteria bacterium]|nr:sensor histidine kinase [Candidatus Saccharibacteria bacterium]